MNTYPLQHSEDSLKSLGGARFFCSLDLASGYWQVEMDAADQKKTAFATQGKLYKFKVMPFGLVNAPATFERLRVWIRWPPARLEGTTVEWHHPSTQALTFLLAGLEGTMYDDWDKGLSERPECLLIHPDTSTQDGRWIARMQNTTVERA